MADKPTYEELEQVKIERKRVESELRISKKLLQEWEFELVPLR